MKRGVPKTTSIAELNAVVDDLQIDGEYIMEDDDNPTEVVFGCLLTMVGLLVVLSVFALTVGNYVVVSCLVIGCVLAAMKKEWWVFGFCICLSLSTIVGAGIEEGWWELGIYAFTILITLLLIISCARGGSHPERVDEAAG